ncbi:MAG: sugar phosphate isomerase/epimerase family protein [Mycetocola sp.]
MSTRTELNPGTERGTRIGLSTYAYFWRFSDRVDNPMTLEQMLDDTAALGGTVFQICDYAPIEDATTDRLAAIRAHADALGIVLELGTRGTDPEHLRRYLGIAEALGVTLLRSMWTSGDDRPDAAESERRLRAIAPELEAAGVSLALETYEQVSSTELVALVDALDHPLIGICLDPANTVANFEQPADVVQRCAPRTLNWHVKDFNFSRNPGWVGFIYTGTALGEGRLDYDTFREAVRPAERGINQIVEFWLPWRDDVPESEQAQATARREAEWTRTTMEYLRSKNNV